MSSSSRYPKPRNPINYRLYYIKVNDIPTDLPMHIKIHLKHCETYCTWDGIFTEYYIINSIDYTFFKNYLPIELFKTEHQIQECEENMILD